MQLGCGQAASPPLSRARTAIALAAARRTIGVSSRHSCTKSARTSGSGRRRCTAWKRPQADTRGGNHSSLAIRFTMAAAFFAPGSVIEPMTCAVVRTACARNGRRRRHDRAIAVSNARGGAVARRLSRTSSRTYVSSTLHIVSKMGSSDSACSAPPTRSTNPTNSSANTRISSSSSSVSAAPPQRSRQRKCRGLRRYSELRRPCAPAQALHPAASGPRRHQPPTLQHREQGFPRGLRADLTRHVSHPAHGLHPFLRIVELELLTEKLHLVRCARTRPSRHARARARADRPFLHVHMTPRPTERLGCSATRHPHSTKEDTCQGKPPLWPRAAPRRWLRRRGQREAVTNAFAQCLGRARARGRH